MRKPVLLALLLLAACAPGAWARKERPGAPPPLQTSPAASPAGSRPERIPAVDPKDPLYGRVEGERFENRCRDDSQCRVGGCSGEVCSAEDGVVTTCEMRAWPQGRAACGCVEGECVWYRGPSGGETPPPIPGQGKPCREGKCPAPLACLAYHGVGGPSGPRLESCEIRCADPGSTCPPGQACVILADGPGRVCRPALQVAPSSPP